MVFARSDELDDPFEGATPLIFKEIERLQREQVRAQLELEGRSPEGIERDLEAIFTDHLAKRYREYVYVNSWHVNERESAAMWQLYGRINESIAMQSTYQKLHASLPSKTKVREVIPAGIPLAYEAQVEEDLGYDEQGNRVIKRQSGSVHLGLIHYIDYDLNPQTWDYFFRNPHRLEE